MGKVKRGSVNIYQNKIRRHLFFYHPKMPNAPQSLQDYRNNLSGLLNCKRQTERKQKLSYHEANNILLLTLATPNFQLTENCMC